MTPIKKKTREIPNMRERQIRARIKEEAFKLMADKGIGEVSMREIAEKVQVTKPVLYYYFKDKEALCSAIIEEYEEQFDEFFNHAIAAKTDAAQLLSCLFERYLDFFRKDPRNSKFFVRIIAYLLSNKFKGNSRHKTPDHINLLSAHMADRKQISSKGLADFRHLARAVLLQIMLSTYVQIHMPEQCHKDKTPIYNKNTASRLARIIVLGVNAYYNEKAK